MRSAPITRRTVLRGAVGVAAGAALAPGLARLAPLRVADAAQDGPPDLILTNATIITMNPAQPTAQAVAIRGGRIVAVGSNEEAAS